MRKALLLLLVVLVGAGGAYAVAGRATRADDRAGACPPGYLTAEQHERLEQREQRAQGDAAREREPARAEREGACFTLRHPEPKGELMTRDTQAAARVTAPASSLKPGAYAAAARDAERLGARVSSLPGAAGDWQPAGKGPLIDDDPNYPEVSGQGLADLNGRVSDFTTDPASGRVFAAVGEGGVWVSDDQGGNWRSIGDNLPTQAVGSVAYGDGVLYALTGDSVFGGGSTYAGAGLYRTTNLGQSWQRASGIPDGVIAFKVAVDPATPSRVYAATGAGLFRSTDSGASFSDVNLPTLCAPYTKPGCFLANMVTDVAVRQTGHAVTAAVGWRAGNKPSVDADHHPESPGNGIYMSSDGAPGSFAKSAATGFTPQNQIGRVELGNATGAQQDHDYLYAIVEDAVKFNGGVEVLDLDGGNGTTGVPNPTALDGVYVSSDFGKTWTKMATPEELAAPGTGSALAGVGCAQLYCPGVQAWYNEWIKPDPTRQDADGVPTRLTFGLEEVWQNRVDDDPQNHHTLFKVIGPYFADETCQFLNTGQPNCPTTGDPATQNKTTTHPDQHSAVYVPHSDGSVTLMVGNDGGAYAQKAAADQPSFKSNAWGRGINKGFNTLLPYDAQVAKDGTIWAGLQDNGEEKIEPSGRQVGNFGGDGGFSAVDPDNAAVAYEQYTFNDIHSTTNGGKSWTDIAPPSDDGYQFINPFVMDPTDAKHLLTAGRGVYERTTGPSGDWTKVYDLGTRKHPGDASAGPEGDDDSINKVSAVDSRGAFTGAAQGGAAGPKTADFDWTGGQDTVPGADGADSLELPGTYSDKPFTIKAGDSDAKATITVTWASDSDDWDLRVLKGDAVVGESLSTGGSGHSEQVTLTAPSPGDYTIRVYNYAATPGSGFSGTARFERAVGTDVTGNGAAAYVGFCGYCDPLSTRPFQRGLATNVGGDKPPKRLSPDGWHIAAAQGLPNRYITSVQMDTHDPRTVYVTLGGYSRRWLPVGALGENTANAGTGHVFKSTDSGQTFEDISDNLPDTPAEWTVVRNGQLIVATDVGVYIAPGTDGGRYETLGKGLPTAPVYTLELKPGDQNTLIAATQGRGVYRYSFAGSTAPQKTEPRKPAPGAAAPSGGNPGAVACTASRGFRTASAARAGRGVRFGFQRRVRNPVTVDVFRQSAGRRVTGERLVARFPHRSRSFTWNGRGNRGRRVADGIYFARYQMRYDAGRQRDFRRITLRRQGGRWAKLPQFYKAASCGLLRSYKLTRPVWGGTTHRSLGIAYRLARPGRVTVEVFRGKTRVRRFAARSRRASHTYRHTLSSQGRPRGDYRVRITVRSGRARLRSTLVSRRL